MKHGTHGKGASNGKAGMPMKFGENESGKAAKMNADAGKKKGYGATSVKGMRQNCNMTVKGSKKY